MNLSTLSSKIVLDQSLAQKRTATTSKLVKIGTLSQVSSLTRAHIIENLMSAARIR